MKFFRYTLLSLSLFCSLEMVSSDNRQMVTTSSKSDLKIDFDDEWERINVVPMPASNSESDQANLNAGFWSSLVSRFTTQASTQKPIETISNQALTSAVSNAAPALSTATQQVLTSVTMVASNPISKSMLTNMPETVKYLQTINANSSTEAFKYDLNYLLRSAAFCGAAEVVTELLNAGANVDMTDENGNSALILASLKPWNLGAVKTLLAAGANTEIQDLQGQTALLYATLYCNEGIAKELFIKGADINKKNNLGGSPLSIATSHRQPILKIFQSSIGPI